MSCKIYIKALIWRIERKYLVLCVLLALFANGLKFDIRRPLSWHSHPKTTLSRVYMDFNVISRAETASDIQINDKCLSRWAKLQLDPELSERGAPQKSSSPPNGTFPKFSRTNRLEGQSRWIKEVYELRKEQRGMFNAPPADGPTSGLLGIGLVVEVCKELLYSGIPEQVGKHAESLTRPPP